MGISASKSGGGVRRGRRRSHRGGAISEINITPMVDVMLVLLIIFMVAAPLMISGVPVNLPDTTAAPLPPETDEQPLTITLTADGRVMIMEEELPEADLVGKLTSILSERTSKKIFVRADGALPYERVAQIMAVLNVAGFKEIGLVTETGGSKLNGSGG